MDRVRFGRALGFGARQAMKTVVATVDAATAENPSSSSKGAGRTVSGSAPATVQSGGSCDSAGATSRRTAAKVAQTAGKTVSQVREAQRGVKRGSRRFGEAVWNPFVRLSGVLWLEVMGVFFGLFALFALGAVWRLRGEWHLTATNAEGHRSLLGSVAMLALFGYFCVSSFVRAKRRERGR